MGQDPIQMWEGGDAIPDLPDEGSHCALSDASGGDSDPIKLIH